VRIATLRRPRLACATSGRDAGAAMRPELGQLEREIERCALCPRLVRWRERAALSAPPRVEGAQYWSKPVPSFGPRTARILFVGLAPGAHGANRTGRPFTGDGAGPFLYGALYRLGLASKPGSVAPGDGLRLRGVRITNAVRCVPPGNRPTGTEVGRCARFLGRELELLGRVRVVVCLGEIAWRAVWGVMDGGRPRPRFGHGAVVKCGERWMVGSYHPSQLNTRTRRLTEGMFEEVVRGAMKLARQGR
jgi:uracil-DNA glycosylase